MSINHITPTDIEVFKAYGTMNQYQDVATKSAFYPGRGTPLGLIYVALKGAGEAGEFAEHVGKAMRDDRLLVEAVGTAGAVYAAEDEVCLTVGALSEARKLALIKEIGDQLWYLAAKCNELGVTLEDAALVNLQKLADRSSRGVLQGSGDDR